MALDLELILSVDVGQAFGDLKKVEGRLRGMERSALEAAQSAQKAAEAASKGAAKTLDQAAKAVEKVEEESKGAAEKVKKTWRQAAESVLKETKNKWVAAAALIDESSTRTQAGLAVTKTAAVAAAEANESLGSAAKKAGKAQEEGIRGNFKALRQLRDRLNLMQFAWAAVRKAIVGTALATAGLLVVTKQVAAYSNTREGLLNLGVDEERLGRISKILGGTVAKIDLRKQLKDALSTGAASSQLEGMAKSAAFLAKNFGESKEAMLAMVASGELGDAKLQKLGISRLHIENEIAAAERRQEGALSDVEKTQIKIREIIKATRRSSNNWTKSTKQAGDEAAKTLASLKNIAVELGRLILPALARAAKSVEIIAKGVVSVFNQIRKIATIEVAPWLNTLLGGGNKLASAASSVGGAFTTTFNKLKGFGTLFGDVMADIFLDIKGVSVNTIKAMDRGTKGISAFNHGFDKLLGIVRKTKQEAKDLPKVLMPNIADAIKKSSKDLDAFFKAEATKQKARAKRLQEEMRRQFLEDLKALQDQAKDLVRNFSEKIVQTVADAGGSFGAIASALTDIFEKTRIFSSTGFGSKAITAVAKVASQFQGKMNVDLIKQVDLQKKSLGLRGKSLQAAKLLAGWIRGGADDTREFLANERAANVQLKAGLSTLQSTAKVGQLRLEQANLLKDVTQFSRGAQTTINALVARRNDLEWVGTKTAMAKAALHDVIIKRLRLTVRHFKTIAAERRRILSIAQAHAKIDREMEIRAKARARAASLRSAQRRAMDARNSADAAGGTVVGDRVAQIARAGQRAREDVRAEISKMQAQAQSIAAKIRVGGLDSQEMVQMDLQLHNLKQRIELRQKEIAEITRGQTAQINAITHVGAAFQKMMRTSKTESEIWAEAFKQGILGTANSALQTIGSLATDLVSKPSEALDNLGKNVLNAFGDMALQLAAFFGAEALGMAFTPGGQAAAVGLGAAAVALAGIGGTLKGVAATINPPKKPGGASSSSPARTGLPGAQPREREKSETYILVTNSIFGSEEQQARELKRFISRNRRALGGRAL